MAAVDATLSSAHRWNNKNKFNCCPLAARERLGHPRVDEVGSGFLKALRVVQDKLEDRIANLPVGNGRRRADATIHYRSFKRTDNVAKADLMARVWCLRRT